MTNLMRHARWLLTVAALAAWCLSARAEDGSAGPGAAPAVLHLADGDFFTGTLEDCDTPDVVRWQSVGASGPFDFPASVVRAAYFAPPSSLPAAEGEYCFELSDGDILYGALAGLTAEQIEIESPRFGSLHVDRKEVRRMTPWSGSATWAYSGPNGLAEWEQQPEKDLWHEEAGRLVTDVPGAAVHKKFAIPQQARIEFDIAWSLQPAFTLTIDAGTTDEQQKAGFRFEVWDRTLVVLRELEQEADVARVCQLTTLTDRVHLEAFFDQEKGTLSVHSLDGTKLAEISMPSKDSSPKRVERGNNPILPGGLARIGTVPDGASKKSERFGWISLINRRGDLRLEQLVISRWDGQTPAQVDVDKPRVYQTDGTIVYGDVVDYQAAAKQFVVQQESEEKRIDAGQVASVVLTPAVASTGSSLRVGFHDGSRVSGSLAKVAAGKVSLTRRGVEESLVFPIAEVRSLVGLRRDYKTPPNPWRVGRLELNGVRSHGTFVEAKPEGGGTCLVWQPRHSATSSPLPRDVSGRIVYRDPPPPVKNPPEARQRRVQPVRPPQPLGFFGAIAQAFTGPPQPERPPGPSPSRFHTLYLLAGDRIPCKVTEIDEDGVRFTSTVVDSEFVPHSEIKALELVPNLPAGQLAEEKRQRLLTLPRMQKHDPPANLIVSSNGDFLRARLISMNATTLVVETRLETKQLPRDRVTRIIWLHDSNESPTPATKTQTVDAAATRVQAVRADGVRLTFVPRECTGGSLIGTSELLGNCQVDVTTVDQILLGAIIDTAADEQTYHVWKLHDAVEPRFVDDAAPSGSGGGPTGLESGLVGKPAPDFKLDLLDGGQFRLNQEKGHVVVLDFWASWCGPCMQAMPVVDQVAEEFREKGVKLFAVNLQEDRVTVAGALERLKLHPAVALDVDGAAAERFEVTAIPQTVVVDAEGNIARLFIGANPNFAEQLREALQELVEKDHAGGMP